MDTKRFHGSKVQNTPWVKQALWFIYSPTKKYTTISFCRQGVDRDDNQLERIIYEKFMHIRYWTIQ